MQANIHTVIEALNAIESVNIWKMSEPRIFPCVAPQIYFEAPLELARALRKELLADAKADSSRLRAPWDVSLLTSSNELVSRLYLHLPSYDYEMSKVFPFSLMFRENCLQLIFWCWLK